VRPSVDLDEQVWPKALECIHRAEDHLLLEALDVNLDQEKPCQPCVCDEIIDGGDGDVDDFDHSFSMGIFERAEGAICAGEELRLPAL